MAEQAGVGWLQNLCALPGGAHRKRQLARDSWRLPISLVGSGELCFSFHASGFQIGTSHRTGG